MKGKGLGWLLLVGALAVPAVLFLKWWTQMQAAQGVEARQAVPAAQPFGPTSAPEAAASGPPVEPASEAPGEAAVAPSGPAQEPPPQEAQAQPAEPEAAAPAAEPPPKTPTAPPAEGGAVLAYMPKTARDPMLSVFDVRELARQKEARRLAEEQLRRAAEELRNPPEPKAPPPRPLCDSLDLQGIIGAGGDIAAIVNDNVVREGDMVGGALVQRVTTRTVVFKKGRKTCTKRVTR